MTATERHIIRTVLRHNGIATTDHKAHVEQDRRSSHKSAISKRALKNYRAIYASLSLEERMAAHGHAIAH